MSGMFVGVKMVFFEISLNYIIELLRISIVNYEL